MRVFLNEGELICMRNYEVQRLRELYKKPFSSCSNNLMRWVPLLSHFAMKRAEIQRRGLGGDSMVPLGRPGRTSVEKEEDV